MALVMAGIVFGCHKTKQMVENCPDPWNGPQSLLSRSQPQSTQYQVNLLFHFGPVLEYPN